MVAADAAVGYNTVLSGLFSGFPMVAADAALGVLGSINHLRPDKLGTDPMARLTV